TWDQRIVVIAIDDPSLQKLGRYPWNRRRFTQLMQVLNQTETSVVVFDVIFSESAAEDIDFARAIDKHGQVILAKAVDFNGLPLQPVQQLQAAALDVGHIFRLTDGDGVTRHIPLNFRGAPALSAVTLQAYGFQHAIPPLPNMETDLWLNWVNTAPKIQQYSFADVLSGQIPPQVFQDKIVIVGVSATGFDTLSTPFDRNPPATGTYLHATAIHNLLANNQLQRPLSGQWFGLILLLAMPGFGFGLSYLKVRWQVIFTVGSVLLWCVVVLLAIHANAYLPTVLPIGLVVGTATAVAITERLRMHDFLQLQLQQLSSTYLSEVNLEPSTINSPTIDGELMPDQALTYSRRFALPPIWRSRLLEPSRAVVQLKRHFHLPSSQPTSIQSLNQLMRIAAQLGRAQATQQAIAQSLSVGILAIDPQGLIWFCNDVASQWLQVNIGDDLATGLVPLWFDRSTWKHLSQRIMPQFDRAEPSLPSELCDDLGDPRQLLEGDDWPHTIKVLVNDRWFLLSFSPLQEAAALEPSITSLEAMPGLVLLIEDITSRKQIETNLERQVQELQWLAQLKDELIGRVSHELRSPITNMLMSIELLRTTENPEQRDNYLDLLETECLQERNFINDLLSLQSPVLVQPVRPLTWIRLDTWLEHLIAPFLARAVTRQQTITLEINPDLPALHADEQVLERIYQELLTNACKYSPAGAKIYCTARQQGEMIQLAVRNLGVTIAPEELPRIFEKFYRVPESDPWKQGGTGLGLSIVDRLAKQIQATIQVRSEADVTEFQLKLPIEPQLPPSPSAS
ncbi:CHASE2 domain-containing protein, partial [filamentous cyanobacterium LEGE 11480]